MKRNRKVWQYIYASLMECYNLIVNNYQEKALGVRDNSWLLVGRVRHEAVFSK